jgi:hypothetical protein
VYYRNLYTKKTLVKVPTGQLLGSGQGEPSATPVRFDIDNRMRSICTVDERGGEKIGKRGKRKTISRGLSRGYMYMYKARSGESRFNVN